jgi:glycosyltransferase involved in cell wall biosynthesis
MSAALLEAVDAAGWDVVHVDTSDHRSIDNIGAFDVGNVVLGLRHAVSFAARLLRTQPDIVYLPLSQGVAGFTRDAVFLFTSRLSTARVVVHAHGGLYEEFYRRMPAAVRVLMRGALAKVDVIIVLSEAQRRQFDGWAPARCRVVPVPNGVRDEWPGGPPGPDADSDGVVLYLGNLLPEKGFLDALDAVPSVLRHAPRARFVFAGRAAWDPATASLVRQRLADPVVRAASVFTGVVEPAERRRLLAAADLLVFPPRWKEGQGLVALEAMSAGLPIVATASGGLAETLRDGEDAIVVPGHDPAAIAQAVTRLLLDPTLRACMGAEGRARFEREYTLERWAARMLASLDGVLGGRGEV